MNNNIQPKDGYSKEIEALFSAYIIEKDDDVRRQLLDISSQVQRNLSNLEQEFEIKEAMYLQKIYNEILDEFSKGGIYNEY